MPGLRCFQANSAAKSQYNCLHLNQAGLADIYHFWGGVPVQYNVHGVFWCLLLHHLNTKCSLSLKINIKSKSILEFLDLTPILVLFISYGGAGRHGRPLNMICSSKRTFYICCTTGGHVMKLGRKPLNINGLVFTLVTWPMAAIVYNNDVFANINTIEGK